MIQVTPNLKLRIPVNASADATYNLQRIDDLASRFIITASASTGVLAIQDVNIEPQAQSIGGSGSGGYINLGTSAHTLAGVNIYAAISAMLGVGLRDQASGGTANLTIDYNSTAGGGSLDTTARTLQIALQGASRIMAMGGNIQTVGAVTTGGALTTSAALTTTGGALAIAAQSGGSSVIMPVSGTLATLAGVEHLTNKTLDSTSTVTGVEMASFTPDGAHTLTAPDVTDTLVTLAATQTLTNKSIDGGSNTITGLTNSAISPTAAIQYSKLNLSSSIRDSDVSATAAIQLSKLATLAANQVVVSSGGGVLIASGVSTTQLGYISNLSSDAQAQLNAKLASNFSNSTLSGQTAGDLLYASTATSFARLPAGSSGQVLRIAGGVPTWSTGASGDVSGPGSSVAGQLAVYTDTTGANIGTTPATADGSGNLSLPNQAALKLFEATGSGTAYVAVRSPASLSGGSYTLSLPQNTGNSNEFIQGDGSGNLSWANALSALTGDVSASGSGSVAATVNSVGGASAAAVASAATAVAAASTSATANTLALRDGSANLYANTLYAMAGNNVMFMRVNDGTPSAMGISQYAGIAMDIVSATVGTSYVQLRDDRPATGTAQLLSRNARHLLLAPDGTDATKGVISAAQSGQTAAIHQFQSTLGGTTVAQVGLTGVLTSAPLAGSYALASDSGGDIVASSTTATELGYLHGVTSAVQTQLNARILTSAIGAANGVASLDSSGRLPLSQVTLGIYDYQGQWNPNTNSPALADGTGTQGYTYIVSAAKSGTVSGLTDPTMTNFQAGNQIIYNGSKWQQTTPAAGVQYVNGSQGSVTVNAISQLTSDVTTSTASGSQSLAATVAAIQGKTVSGTTGTTNVVFSNSPTLVTPALGTPTALVLTNATGLPLTSGAGVTGTLPVANGGTGGTTSTGSGAVVLATSPTLTTPNLGTPSAAVLTNATGLVLTGGAGVTGVLPVANGGTGVSTSTGSGATVLGTAPTLSGPVVSNYQDFSEQSSAPSAPSSGTLRVFAQTGDTLAYENSAGTTTTIGTGSGQKNYLALSTSTATGWTASSSAITVATDTTAADLPRAITTATGIKITGVSGSTAYVYNRFTLDSADYNTKLQLQFALNGVNGVASGYASNGMQVSVYSNTASNYGGTYTRLPLSTDSSSVTGLPALDGTFKTSFDAPGSAQQYIEVRFGLNSTTTASIVISDLILGPGTVIQGAAVGPWLPWTPTFAGFGTTTNVSFFARRVGESYEVRGTFTTGTTTGTTAAIILPTGTSINSAALSSSINTRLGEMDRMDGSNFWGTGTNLVVFYDGSTTSQVFLAYAAGASAYTKMNGNVVGNSENEVVRFTYPAAELAGSGTVNVVQNDVEYASNYSTSTSSSDTTSFAYGPSGNLIQNISAVLNRTVQFQTPISATTQLVLEVSEDQQHWFPLPYLTVGGSDINVWTKVNGTEYGMCVRGSSTAATQAIVHFGTYASSTGSTTYGGAGTAWSGGVGSLYWRVKKFNAGQAVGFSIAQPGTAAGLVSASGVPSNTTGNAIATGYIGNVVSSAFNTGGSAVGTANTFVNVASISVPPGIWQISGTTIGNSNTTDVSTDMLSMAVSLYSGNTTTDHAFGDNYLETNAPTAANTAQYATMTVANWIKTFSTTTTVYLKFAGTNLNNRYYAGRITAVCIG